MKCYRYELKLFEKPSISLRFLFKNVIGTIYEIPVAFSVKWVLWKSIKITATKTGATVCRQVFKKSVLKSFTKFIGKCLCWSLFWWSCRPATSLNFITRRISCTGLFLWILWNVEEHLLCRKLRLTGSENNKQTDMWTFERCKKTCRFGSSINVHLWYHDGIHKGA